jgi:hypothetical protein
MSGRGRAMGVASSIAVMAALTAAPAANATTFTVNSLADSGANTLRQALLSANDDVDRDDVINITATGQINLATQLPGIGPESTDGELDINGPGASQLDVHRPGGPNFIVIGVAADADASISGIKISGGVSPSSGGGVFNFGNLELTGVEVSGNSVTGPADVGGGIYSSGTGTLTVRQSAIVGNASAGGGGGGITVGGGSTALLERSTVSGNTTTGLSAGGIRVSGTDSTLTIRSSTIANNTGDATVSVAKNASADNSGLIILQNTILADPHTPTPADTPPNCGTASSGTISSLGFNLADDASCSLIAAGDKPSTDPGLAALALNSGPTQTQAIAKDSPATDAGLAGFATGAFDQRGLTRPVDFSDVANAVGSDATDIGAFEVQLPVTTQPPTPPPATPTKKKKCKKKRKKKRSAGAAAKKCKKKKK